MYLFLCILGPGALTYLIADKCSGDDKKSDWFRKFMELLVYSTINVVVTGVLLKPFGRFEVVVTPDGGKTICYGIVTLAAALMISVISGIVVAAIKKHVDIKMQVTPKEGVSDENRKEK